MIKNKILRNLFSLSLAEVATKGITFILNAYLARILGVEGYGIIANIVAILAYATLVVQLGFCTIGIRSIASKPEEKEKYVNNVIALKLIIAIFAFAGIALYAVMSNETDLVKMALLLGGLQLFGSAIQIDWFFQGIERMEIIGLRTVLVNLVTLIGVLIFVRQPEDIPIYMLIVSVSLIANNFWLIAIFIKQYAKIKLQASIAFWKELMQQNIPLGIQTLFVTIISNFNVICLTQICGNYDTGLFGVAFKLFMIAVLPANIIQNTFGPQISRAATLEERQRVYRKVSQMLLFCGALVTTVLLFYPQIFIYIIFGHKFIPATDTLRILMATCFISYYNYTISPVLLMWKEERKVMWSYGIAAVVSIAINISLINVFGANGAALATTGTECTLAIILSYILYKRIHHLQISMLLKFFVIAIVAGCIGKGAVLLIGMDGYYIQIVGIVITVAIYLFLSLRSKAITMADIRNIKADENV